MDYILCLGLGEVRIHLRHFRLNATMSEVRVEGNGLLVEHLRETVQSFFPQREFNFDMLQCMPNPMKPKLRTYGQICGLLGAIWLSLFFEAFGLRIRHKILAWYYPALAVERAHWLYLKIITQRKQQLVLLRREARRKFLKDSAGSNSRWCTTWWWFAVHGVQCCLCQKWFRRNADLIRCVQVGCKGKYCHGCIAQLQGTCPLCMDPVAYGDFSDYSEEFGSTDEEDFHVFRYVK